MAEPCTCRNASGTFTNDNGIPKPISVISCAPTFTSVPAQILALISTSTSASSLLERYIDKNLQRATKLILKLFAKDQKHNQL